MKFYCVLSALILVGSCATTKYSTKIKNLEASVVVQTPKTMTAYAETIQAETLKAHLYQFASNEFKGREVGTEGQKKASQFLVDFYKAEGLLPAAGDSTFMQKIPKDFLPEQYEASENIVAYIKGTDYPDETLIISGHFDHLGVENAELYFGADDNGSGTVAIMEIAQAFKTAERNGVSPKRNILFLHLTAEEIGLQGSYYYTKNPLFALDKTVANLNIDMIGRVDDRHKNNPNYIYIIGADRISKELHFISEKVNSVNTNLELDYKYNAEDDPNHYYSRSDHYNFAQHDIPVIFYFNGEHPDYHKPTDTADKINYPLLEKRAQLIFSTAWYIANMDHQLIRNEDI
ncbi:M28 family peptidase [Olleya sp. YS]|uniref:M28 family peptidase n=1 Tax=Olleya sp. YS TaxID=3028318 RepID=UPI0024342D00|nr:M28 family peptidase [Olleya sp. YS]WGD34181.1 M28 family peptidase [Olleya sp. YS]